MFLLLVLGNVLTLSVNLADNIMLGSFSETSLAGAAAVNQIQFVYQSLLSAFAEGVVILGSQFFGAGQTAPIKKISAHAVRMGLFLAVIMLALTSIIPGGLLRCFTEDEAIIAEGLKYLSLMRISYVFFALTQVLLGVLRSVGVVKIAPVLSASTLVVNCCINYTLIFGHFGAPRMGIAGAAVGTVTARVIELVIIVVYIRLRERKLDLRLKDMLSSDRDLFGRYVKVTLPVLLVSGLWGMNTAVQNAIMGHVSSQAFAANNVASTLFMLVKSGAIGSASAAGFFMGKTVGEAKTVGAPEIKRTSRTLQVLFVMIGAVSAVTLFFIRIPILSFYDLSPETRELADRFMMLLSAVVFFMAYQMPTNMGIIRGGGNTRFPMLVDIISIWGIMLPVSWLLAFKAGAAPWAVVLALNSDQIFKCVPIFIKANFGKWAKKLTG